MDLLNELESLFDEPKKETPAVVSEERELFTHLPFIEAHQQYCNAYGYIVPKKYRDQFWDPANPINLNDSIKFVEPTPAAYDGAIGMMEAQIKNGVTPTFNVKSPAYNKPEPIKIDVPLSEPQQLSIEPNTDDKGQANLFDSFNFVETPVDEEKGKETLDFYKDKMAGMASNKKEPKLDNKIDYTEQKNYDGTLENKITIDEETFLPKTTPMLDKALQQSENVTPMFDAGFDPYLKEDNPIGVSSIEKHVTTYQGRPEPVVQIEGKDFIELIILGDPTAQKRHKHRHIPGTKFVQNYDPSAADKADFLAIVQAKAPEQPLVGPIRMDIYAFFARPKSHYRTGSKSHILKDDAPEWKISTPDRDNLDKFVMDALNSIFWKDDSQICAGEIEKKYDNITPRTIIRISRP